MIGASETIFAAYDEEEKKGAESETW